MGKDVLRSSAGEISVRTSLTFLKRVFRVRRWPLYQVPGPFFPSTAATCRDLVLLLSKGSSRWGRFGSGEQMVYQEGSPFRETMSLSSTLSRTCWHGNSLLHDLHHHVFIGTSTHGCIGMYVQFMWFTFHYMYVYGNSTMVMSLW